VEYYVVESYGTYNPARQFGNNTKILQTYDGSYTIGKNQLIRNAVVPEYRVLNQVWSVRNVQRAAGTVNMKEHFDAWETTLHMKFGTLDFQIVAVEGYRSSGASEMKVEKSN
jgi:endo-1,4-beta-xylanase